MGRHGRAVMPWGKYRGVRMAHIPDAYLSWLAGLPWLAEESSKWWWLRASIVKEMGARGLRAEVVEEEEALPVPADPPRRRIRLEPEL